MIKSLAIFFIAMGLLLAGISLPACAQDETPSSAAVEQVEAGTQTTAEVKSQPALPGPGEAGKLDLQLQWVADHFNMGIISKKQRDALQGS